MTDRKRSRWFFVTLVLWCLYVVIVCLRIYLHPGSHSVFTEYRGAGGARIHQAEVYEIQGTFLYSPLIAALYSPFALISKNVSEVLWRVLLGLALPLAL
jgi:hypothetical protein